MTEEARHHIDISNLPRRIKEGIEHYESVVGALRDRACHIAMAAMVRDPTIVVVLVALETDVYQPTRVLRVVLEGIADPDLRHVVEARLWAVLLDSGWQEARRPEGQTRSWRLIDVRRHEASAHEMAAMARAVGL